MSKHAVLVMCQSDGKSEANVLAGSLSESTLWARNNIAACFGEQRWAFCSDLDHLEGKAGPRAGLKY